MDERFFGRRHYRYIDGARHAVGQSRHERVRPGETAAAFVARIEQIVQQRIADGATDVQADEEVQDDRLVGCLISWSHPPVFAPPAIETSMIVAGGRTPGPRGRRGVGRQGSGGS